MEILSDPMNLPSPFWDYMVRKWLHDAPVFPISQVFGYHLQTTMAGVINANGTTKAGFGFIVVRLSAGRYNVAFNTPYNSQPSIVASCLSNANTVIVIGSPSGIGFIMDIRDSATGVSTDEDWNFLAFPTA
jgi:hypothetical protein